MLQVPDLEKTLYAKMDAQATSFYFSPYPEFNLKDYHSVEEILARNHRSIEKIYMSPKDWNGFRQYSSLENWALQSFMGGASPQIFGAPVTVSKYVPDGLVYFVSSNSSTDREFETLRVFRGPATLSNGVRVS